MVPEVNHSTALGVARLLIAACFVAAGFAMFAFAAHLAQYWLGAFFCFIGGWFLNRWWRGIRP